MLKISEDNQMELSRHRCKKYQYYDVKSTEIDVLNKATDSTLSGFLSRSLGAAPSPRALPDSALSGAQGRPSEVLFSSSLGNRSIFYYFKKKSEKSGNIF